MTRPFTSIFLFWLIWCPNLPQNLMSRVSSTSWGKKKTIGHMHTAQDSGHWDLHTDAMSSKGGFWGLKDLSSSWLWLLENVGRSNFGCIKGSLNKIPVSCHCTVSIENVHRWDGQGPTKWIVIDMHQYITKSLSEINL